MWDSLRDEVAAELAEVEVMLQRAAELVQPDSQGEKPWVEEIASAALCHSFYLGVENILKRIAIHLDGGLPAGEQWHRELLDRSCRPTTRHGPVLSEEMVNALGDYLAIRHVFRNIYMHKLEWRRFSHLVVRLPEVHERFADEVRVFIGGLGTDPAQDEPRTAAG